MAKVESVNSSSLKFGLGTTKDCSLKCDFDISSLLKDNETCLEKQHIDNDNWNGRKSDNKKGKHSPVTTIKTESPKFTSLGVLAENHLKKNKMFPELSFDSDFNLSDLLSNDDHSVVKESKNAVLCENDNLFDLCLLTEDDNNLCIGRTSRAKNDISFDDLTEWMNSSVTQTSDSLEGLNNSQFSYDDKLDNVSSANTISNVDLLDILGEISIDSSETTHGINTTDSSDTTSENVDIDLTFCIKKNHRNDFSLYGNSPETIDSGIESDFVPDKQSTPPEGQLFYKNNFIFQNSICSTKSAKIKQSLFSRAISSKPKIDDLRKLKLKNVMNELLKGSVPHCIQQKNVQKIIDHSNEHVIISNYLNFPSEK